MGICTSDRSNAGSRGADNGRNPLRWALASLAAQEGEIDAVHVVKHGVASAEFDDLIAEMSDVLPIVVEVWDRIHPLGALRDRLVELAGDDLLYILDDDAILSTPTTLLRQRRAFDDAELGVLQAPVLRRTLHASPLSDPPGLGRVDPRRGQVSFGFGTATGTGRTPRPFAIDHLCLAQCLLDPVAVRAVGGFTTFPWPAVYGQESELAVRLAQAGRQVAFLPDREAAVVHLKFGAPHWAGRCSDDAVLAGGTRFAPASALAEAAGDGERVTQDWSRKPSGGFFADFVSGFGAVFAHSGESAVDRFLANVVRDFVVENRIHHPFVLPMPVQAERVTAFQEGVARLSAAGLCPVDAGSDLLAAAAPARRATEEIWI